MPTDTDRLCDLANTASYLAQRSHRLDDHASAAKAHYAAWKAASGGGGGDKGYGDRPSLGESHLRRAAEHDKIATEPDSYAQKRELAQAASKKAEGAPGAASFRTAAAAHKAAAAAWRKENPQKGGTAAGDPWEPRDHDRQAQSFEDQAEFVEKQEGKASPAEDVAKKLGAKLDPPAAKGLTPAQGEAFKAKTFDARGLAKAG